MGQRSAYSVALSMFVTESSHSMCWCIRRVIAALVSYAQRQGCYKVILDCSDSNVPFYQKCGFTRKEVQMVSYLPHAAL